MNFLSILEGANQEAKTLAINQASSVASTPPAVPTKDYRDDEEESDEEDFESDIFDSDSFSSDLSDSFSKSKHEKDEKSEEQDILEKGNQEKRKVKAEYEAMQTNIDGLMPQPIHTLHTIPKRGILNKGRNFFRTSLQKGASQLKNFVF
eukprot:GHVP01051767.1.p1 GENE.GHVP01051767.1~~GHVP01051767.1.p1  ORF type:complete len:149 (-),score=42.02 GHVP01051767.1:263-709(-)